MWCEGSAAKLVRVSAMRRWLVIVSLAFHFVLIAVLFVVGAWRLDRLEAGRHKIDLAVQLQPPELVKSTMLHEGHDRVTASFQVCLDAAGGVTGIKMLGSGSGYIEYDQALSAAMHAWRYRPYIIDGQATAVCGVVTFIYTMK